MNDTTEKLAKIAAAIEEVAADVRNMKRADIMPIVEQLDTAITQIRMMDIALANSEYYECDICTSDFHTEEERGGIECRQIRNSN